MFFVGTMELSLVLRWALEVLERQLSSGLKTLAMVHCILPLRTVNAACKAVVDLIDISVLLRETMSDPCRTVKYHNKSLHMSDRCVEIVEAMQLLWILPFRAQQRRMNQLRMGDQPRTAVGSIEIGVRFIQTGQIKSISDRLVSHIHDQWRLTMNSIAWARAEVPRQRFGQMVGPMLIGGRPRHLSNWTTAAGRSASEPRIARRRSGRSGRSKSIPRDVENRINLYHGSGSN